MLSMAVLLMPWFMLNAVHAESVTVSVSATVILVDDPYGVVPDIQPGYPIDGEYTYETTTPDQDPTVQLGFYPHGDGSGYFNLVVGPYQVVTDTAQTNAFEVFIDDEYSPGSEYYAVGSSMLLPSNGATFNFTYLDMQAYAASALQSASLTFAPPDPGLFDHKQVHIDGVKNGQYFHVVAELADLSGNGQTAIQQTRYKYRANAVVTSLYDPNGMLAGKVGINDMIAAGFVYDVSTPNTSGYSGEGFYMHAPGTGGVSVSFADVLLTTDPLAQTPEVHVFNSDDPYGWDHLGLFGKMVTSNNTAISAYEVDVFFDGPGTVLDSIEMPAGNLSLSGWENARVMVNGEGWYFEAAIISLELVPTQVVEVFPSDGRVHPMQHFDMALRVNDQAVVMGINGMNNGQDVSPYLAGCAILPRQELTQSVVCPDITQILMPGGNALQFHLMLDDGSVLETGVNWEVRD
jgi:hypothetical protein